MAATGNGNRAPSKDSDGTEREREKSRPGLCSDLRWNSCFAESKAHGRDVRTSQSTSASSNVPMVIRSEDTSTQEYLLPTHYNKYTAKSDTEPSAALHTTMTFLPTHTKSYNSRPRKREKKISKSNLQKHRGLSMDM